MFTKQYHLLLLDEINPEKVNIGKVINTLNSERVPKELFYGVDGIYVAHLPEFDEREINAVYKDAAIYVTNHQDNRYGYARRYYS